MFDMTILIGLEFFTTMVSNCGSASARESHKALGVSGEFAVFAFTSTYV